MGDAAAATGDEKISYIRDVWHDTLDAEMAQIRELIVQYPVISMDTEFPGVVAKPIGSFKSTSDFLYQTLRCNVDLLKIIQLGLTFSNDEGELAPGVCTYQFNFKFSLNDDIYAQDSIDLLTRSGIDFRRHEDVSRPAPRPLPPSLGERSPLGGLLPSCLRPPRPHPVPFARRARAG